MAERYVQTLIDHPERNVELTGLWWNRYGELYYIKVDPSGTWFRITNCTTCTETASQPIAEIHRHLSVGWFRRCTLYDLVAGFGATPWVDRWV